MLRFCSGFIPFSITMAKRFSKYLVCEFDMGLIQYVFKNFHYFSKGENPDLFIRLILVISQFVKIAMDNQKKNYILLRMFSKAKKLLLLKS